MAAKLNRKDFLKIGTGSTVGLLMSGFVKPAWGETSTPVSFPLAGRPSPDLITLDANPPFRTTAVRYYIDDIRISELTNLYALETQTTPVWKTVVGSEWIGPGEHLLRIEADTPAGAVVLSEQRITVGGEKERGRFDGSMAV